MSDEKKTIGFLGAGNMAEALCRSLLASDLASPESVIAYDLRRERLDLFERELGVRAAATPEEVLRVAQVIVLAFKPQDAEEALRPLRDHFSPGHLVVSIPATDRSGRGRGPCGRPVGYR